MRDHLLSKLFLLVLFFTKPAYAYSTLFSLNLWTQLNAVYLIAPSEFLPEEPTETGIVPESLDNKKKKSNKGKTSGRGFKAKLDQALHGQKKTSIKGKKNKKKAKQSKPIIYLAQPTEREVKQKPAGIAWNFSFNPFPTLISINEEFQAAAKKSNPKHHSEIGEINNQIYRLRTEIKNRRQELRQSRLRFEHLEYSWSVKEIAQYPLDEQLTQLEAEIATLEAQKRKLKQSQLRPDFLPYLIDTLSYFEKVDWQNIHLALDYNSINYFKRVHDLLRHLEAFEIMVHPVYFEPLVKASSELLRRLLNQYYSPAKDEVLSEKFESKVATFLEDNAIFHFILDLSAVYKRSTKFYKFKEMQNFEGLAVYKESFFEIQSDSIYQEQYLPYFSRMSMKIRSIMEYVYKRKQKPKGQEKSSLNVPLEGFTKMILALDNLGWKVPSKFAILGESKVPSIKPQIREASKKHAKTMVVFYENLTRNFAETSMETLLRVKLDGSKTSDNETGTHYISENRVEMIFNDLKKLAYALQNITLIKELIEDAGPNYDGRVIRHSFINDERLRTQVYPWTRKWFSIIEFLHKNFSFGDIQKGKIMKAFGAIEVFPGVSSKKIRYYRNLIIPRPQDS